MTRRDECWHWAKLNMVCPRIMLEEDDEEEDPSDDALRQVEEDVAVKQYALQEPELEDVQVREGAAEARKMMYAEVERMMRELSKMAGDALADQWIETVPRPEGVPDFGYATEPFVLHGMRVDRNRWSKQIIRGFKPFPGVNAPGVGKPGYGTRGNPAWVKPKDGAAVIRQAEELIKKGFKPEVVVQSAKGSFLFLKVKEAFGKVPAGKIGLIFWASIAYQLITADRASARAHWFGELKKAGLMHPEWKGTGWYTGAGEWFSGTEG